MSTVSLSPPRFDEVFPDPDGSLIAYRQYVKTPDWNRLALYYHLRNKFLSEALPDSYETVANLPLPGAEA
jgi:hypothetical protein